MGFGLPVVPHEITVHLGAPRANARRVTVPFIDYIKNVASSEVYPTWPEQALRANILAIVSFALNRVYTEFYRAQNLPFDITNSTQFDQAYIHGRVIFDSISRLVDEHFDDYIRRRGHVEPMFAQYCSGRSVTCRGMSQWGSFDLARQGFSYMRILQHYYSNNIEIVYNAPQGRVLPSYPGRLLRRGSSGESVRTIQMMLARISRNFPAIPRPVVNSGVFDARTEQAVRVFQRTFNLAQDGIVGPLTWNRIRQIFNGVKRLNELNSEGLTQEEIQMLYSPLVRWGDRGFDVRAVQLYLRFYSMFYPAIPNLTADGIFGPITDGAVRAFQQRFGLTVDGIVGRQTYNMMVNQYAAHYNRLPAAQRRGVYPGRAFSQGDSGAKVRELQQLLNAVAPYVPAMDTVTVDGNYGVRTTEAVRAFQYYAQLPLSGDVGIITWNALLDAYLHRSEMSDNPATVRFAALD
ncbi:MAG: peptidoglycan-binding protein [Oscillospiraceae bacterium]|nr:peptidoglycan-binding protein [Oscillospiraceae bacterium]